MNGDVEPSQDSEDTGSGMEPRMIWPILAACAVVSVSVFMMPPSSSSLLYVADIGRGATKNSGPDGALQADQAGWGAAEARAKADSGSRGSSTYGRWTGRWLGEAVSYRRRALRMQPEGLDSTDNVEPNSEQALLQSALAALESDDAEHAVGMARKHQRLYPDGLLREKREWLWIRALGQAGKDAAARRRGERFLRDFPDSEHLPSVQRLLATDYEF